MHQQKKERNGAFLLIEGVSSSLQSSGVTWASLLGEGQQRPEKSRFADELEKDALGLFQLGDRLTSFGLPNALGYT